MTDIRTRRLTSPDRELARELFVMMAEVFEEEFKQLSDGYLDRLLSREDFWAIAAFEGDDLIGGITAHSLTDLTHPVIDWPALAKGFGVPASSVCTDDGLAGALRRALAEPGPSLIEAVLA